MPYVIQEECTMCAICFLECPMDAIKDEDIIMVIDQDKCNECGICYELCPDDAIKFVQE